MKGLIAIWTLVLFHSRSPCGVTVANFNKVGLSVVKRLDQAIKVPSPFTEKNILSLDTLLYNCSSLPNS